jgi:hypothetical protein
MAMVLFKLVTITTAAGQNPAVKNMQRTQSLPPYCEYWLALEYPEIIDVKAYMKMVAVMILARSVHSCPKMVYKITKNEVQASWCPVPTNAANVIGLAGGLNTSP